MELPRPYATGSENRSRFTSPDEVVGGSQHMAPRLLGAETTSSRSDFRRLIVSNASHSFDPIGANAIDGFRADQIGASGPKNRF